MATNNATNTSNPISVPQGGTGVSSLSANSVVIGNSSGALQALANGTSGQILTANTSANPTWNTPSSGSIVGYAKTTTSTPTSTSTILSPSAGTTPTTGNTTSFLTLAYTAASVSNILKFDFSCPAAFNNGGGGGFFLFSGNTLISSFPVAVGGTQPNANIASFSIYANPASTSSITYGIYYAAGANTTVMYLLENSTPVTFYNTTSAAFFQITELSP